jgi:hypothetical protein
MIRNASIGLITIASLFLFSTNASAIEFFMGAPTLTNPEIGQTFDITVRLDTQGETDMTSVFISTRVIDPSVATFVSGNAPGSILFNFSTFAGIPRILQPFVDGGDPVGDVRAAGFGAISPTGIASADQLIVTLTYMATGVGSTTIDPFLAPGDDVTVNGESVADSVTFMPSTTITVPEPATIWLSLSALGTVLVVRRRTAA